MKSKKEILKLYKKIYTETKPDFPKNVGEFYFHVIGEENLRFVRIRGRYGYPHDTIIWHKEVDWYLQPTEITDADIEAWAIEYIQRIYIDESFALNTKLWFLITGAKAVLNGEIKHISK